MAHSGTQTSKAAPVVASELVSGRDPSQAVTDREALNNHPSVLAARELIQESRQQVARAQELIERGRELRRKAEETMHRSRRQHANL